uniref:NS7a n=1 Tax=Bat coronavirus HKU9 TaxID=694006 RepID=A0A2P1M5K0_BCHK9|nr:NS7a [Rousettus bat coronavirus HKU9]
MRFFQLLCCFSLMSFSLGHFAFSVLRVCHPTCQSARIHCPPGELVDSDKFEICIPYIPFAFQETGLWKAFQNVTTHAGIRVRLLSSCFKNHYVSGCVGLENRCNHGVVHTQQKGGLVQRLCIRFIEPTDFQPGYRYVFNGKGYTGSQQFQALDHATYNNLAQLRPGEGKTAEDDYEEDEYWFLWQTPKPGSGYERLP